MWQGRFGETWEDPTLFFIHLSVFTKALWNLASFHSLFYTSSCVYYFITLAMSSARGRCDDHWSQPQITINSGSNTPVLYTFLHYQSLVSPLDEARKSHGNLASFHSLFYTSSCVYYFITLAMSSARGRCDDRWSQQQITINSGSNKPVLYTFLHYQSLVSPLDEARKSHGNLASFHSLFYTSSCVYYFITLAMSSARGRCDDRWSQQQITINSGSNKPVLYTFLHYQSLVSPLDEARKSHGNLASFHSLFYTSSCVYYFITLAMSSARGRCDDRWSQQQITINSGSNKPYMAAGQPASRPASQHSF